MCTFAVSVQGNLGTDGGRVGEGVRVAGWFWFTYLFLDTFSFEIEMWLLWEINSVPKHPNRIYFFPYFMLYLTQAGCG